MAGQKRDQCVKIDRQQELELFSILARGWAHTAAKASSVSSALGTAGRPLGSCDPQCCLLITKLSVVFDRNHLREEGRCR